MAILLGVVPLEFERQVVATLKGVEEPVWDQKDLKNGYLITVKLMEKGVPWIHGGVLMDVKLVGIPDLLKKVSERSKFGLYSYIPIEIKAHKQVQKKDILQVVAYSIMLGEVIGKPCTNGGVWLNTNEIEEFEIADHLPAFNSLKSRWNRFVPNNWRPPLFGAVRALYASGWISAKILGTRKGVFLYFLVAARARRKNFKLLG